jgi:hypothetical protein
LLSELIIFLILIQTEGASFDLSDKELFCIEEQEVFDAIYSIVRDFNCLPPALKFNIVETLRSNLSVLLPNIDSLSRASMSSPSDTTPINDRIASHRNAFKIYSFFLISIVLTEESAAESSTGAKVTFVRKIQLFRLFMLLFFELTLFFHENLGDSTRSKEESCICLELGSSKRQDHESSC